MDEVFSRKLVVTCCLILILIYLIYRYLTRNYNHWQARGVACEKPTLLVGNAWEVVSGQIQVGKFFGKLYRKYTVPYFGVYIFDKPYLVLRDPNIIRQVLISDFNNFSDRIFACDKNADVMSGNSVFLLRNPRWRSVRSKLTQIFTLSKLKLMFPIMRGVGEVLDGYLERFDGAILDIKEVSAMYMTDVTALTHFGLQTNSFASEDNVFRQVGRRLFDFNRPRISFSMFAYFFMPPLVTLLKLGFTDKSSTAFMRRIFAEAIADRQRTQVRRNDFVDLLLGLKDDDITNPFPFDEDTMVSQAITFFLAGFESTSNVISFTLYELGMNRDVQDRLRDEIVANIKDDTDVTFDDLTGMKFMDMVLAETMRRYPFAPFLNRKCKSDYLVEETGFTIEKGTDILVPTDGLHYDPHYFPEPDRFRPARFADDFKYTSAVYMPFGAGPRFCIGDRFGILAAKVGLVFFLKRFQVDPCRDTPVPIVLNPRSPFVMSNGGLPMKITKIN